MKSPLNLLAVLVCGLIINLTACHQKSDNSQSIATDDLSPKTKPTQASYIKNNHQLTAHDNFNVACQDLTNGMKNINHKSRFEDIEQIDNLLKQCLPIADNKTQLLWLKQYHESYQRFLSLWDNDQPIIKDEHYNDYYSVMASLSSIDNNKNNHANIHQQDIERLPPRMQYLVKLATQNKLKSLNICEGEYEFTYNYHHLAKIFTPHLPKDQAIFINQLSKDNQDILFCDAAIAISLGELIQRTLFWQDYIQKYPNSYFANDAKILYQEYEYLLFFGSDNTLWLNDNKTDFEPQYNSQDELENIKPYFIELAKHNSPLGEKSQAFLDFVATPLNEREQKYPIDKSIDYQRLTADGYELSEFEIAYLQLAVALDIDKPNNDMNCFTAPLCLHSE